MVSADGRAGWLNTRALAVAGITSHTTAPADGAIVHDTRGATTGIVKGTALATVEHVVPRVTQEDRARGLREAVREAHRNGITSVQETIERPDDFIVYDEARRADDLNVRVYSSIAVDGTPEAEAFKRLESLTVRYPDDPLFKMGGARVTIDGSVESLDAALLQPYEGKAADDPPSRVDPDAFNRFVRLLDARGWQVTAEASGDRAVRIALNAFDHAAKSNPKPARGRRHRVDGIELVDPVDLPRFGHLGAIATVEPLHGAPTATRVDAWASAVGSERASRAWPSGSIASARGRLAFGSAAPLTPFNPFESIQVAVTRTTLDGTPEGGWAPGERVTLKRAINALTAVPAYASFDEQRKGSLTAGMLADLVVLSDDIFDAPATQLANTTVAVTIFDGKIVYRHSAKSTN
jgi:predicted amidohydrolase YtcJ